MGWFSDVVSKIKSVAKSAWEGAKKIAIQAVGWMAEKAEIFIGNVKKVWNHVKPIIRQALIVIGNIVPWPWLKVIIKVLVKVMDWIDRMENTAFGKILKAAIKWVIEAAKELKKNILLSGKELKEAQEREAVFNKAPAEMPPAEKKAVMLAGLINKFIVVQSLIQKAFDEYAISDFEHYLRLRATQRLLSNIQDKLAESQNIDDIGEDDMFLLNIGGEFLNANPNVSESDLNRLNSLIYSRFGKELAPFAFEPMIVAWATNLVILDRQWVTGNKALAKNIVQLRTLENILEMGGKLDAEQNSSLLQLRNSVPSLKADQDVLAKSNREMRNYVYAAEGLLEILEENIDLDGKEYLAAKGSTVGMIIIACAQNGKKWEALNEEEQELIIDFANIFKEASIKRTPELQVGVAA